MIKNKHKLLELCKGFISDRKKLLIYLALVFIVYFLIKVLMTLFGIFGVLEFAILMLMVGLAPAFLLRKVFPFKNIIGWITNASALGLLLSTYIFLIFGWMRINVVFLHSISFLFVLALIGIIYLLVFSDKKIIDELINFNNISIVDVFFYGILLSLAVILSVQNFTDYYPRWDAFTYWGLDAKYIFDFNQLRDGQFDVFTLFQSYPSFYPVIISIIYDIFGTIVEQYASWVNIYIHFLAALLIYNRTIKKNVLIKLVTVTIFIILTYTVDSVAYIFSLYADVLSSFLLLMFALVLTTTRKYNNSPKQYVNRFLLLILLSFALYFVKSRFLLLSIALTFSIFVYDIKYWHQNWKKILRTPKFIIIIILLVAIWFVHITYQSMPNGSLQFNSEVSNFFNTFNQPLSSILNYSKQVFELLMIRSFHISVLFVLSISLIFLNEKPLKNREFLFVYLLMIIMFFTFVLAYIVRQRSLESESLIRYTSIVMYLFPLLINKIHFSRQQRLFRTTSGKNLDQFSMILISILIFISFSVLNSIKNQSMIFQRGINIVEGSYRSALGEFSNLADEVLKNTGNDARIIIADDTQGGNLLQNMNAPTIYIRYFLMYNSVGGQYQKPKEAFLQFAQEKSADYILLLSYEHSFSECENLFEEGHNYLIKFDSDMKIIEDDCMFSVDDIHKISEID